MKQHQISPTSSSLPNKKDNDVTRKVLEAAGMALSASPAPPGNRRTPGEMQTKNDAVRFLLEVKCAFRDDREKYAEFLHLMKSFGKNGIGKDEVISRAKRMFDGQPELLLGFNAFLPKGKKIRTADEEL